MVAQTGHGPVYFLIDGDLDQSYAKEVEARIASQSEAAEGGAWIFYLNVQSWCDFVCFHRFCAVVCLFKQPCRKR